MRIICVIPTYQASATIANVAQAAAGFCDFVLVIDDACPDKSGSHAAGIDERIIVVTRNKNGGVGAATKTGIDEAAKMGADIVVKVDADGQMDSNLIPQLIEPLISGAADFRKGTRFDSPEDLEGMPKLRLIGNSYLSLINKFTSGYWTVNDPTNGFLAFTKNFYSGLSWAKVSDGYFFESDLLFRARLVGTRVSQMRMKSVYLGEPSGMKPLKMILPFAWKHFLNQFKRIAYMYFVREWNLGTIYIVASLASLGIGVMSSVFALVQSQQSSVGTGTAVLASLGYILWVQFSTAFLTVDVTSEPK